MENENNDARPERIPGVDLALEGERGGEELLLCASCGAPITSAEEGVDIDGGTHHTFVNPGGYIYRIGCFRSATGCSVQGRPTEQFSWFSGHGWAYSSCAMCGVHLGWAFFRDLELRFYGLILERLRQGCP